MSISKNIDPASQITSRTGLITPTTGATILARNDDRRTLIIQNLGTNVLYVKLGEAATTADFDFILKAGAGNNDGLGGVFLEDVLSYNGPISVAGTSPRLTATEI